MDNDTTGAGETLDEFGTSFWYGSRSELTLKFLKDLSGPQMGDFLEGLLDKLAVSIDDGDLQRLSDHLFDWQVDAYAGHLGDFKFPYDEAPFAPLTKPVSESRVALVTSSGHFVAGDDPEPFGVENMTQAEAEARIIEFVKEAPTLSRIPVDTSAGSLRVRHGGYPVRPTATDPNVSFPVEHLLALEAEGVIGGLHPEAFSFVGAASQLGLRKRVAPEWATMLQGLDIDVVLLVPV